MYSSGSTSICAGSSSVTKSGLTEVRQLKSPQTIKLELPSDLFSIKISESNNLSKMFVSVNACLLLSSGMT